MPLFFHLGPIGLLLKLFQVFDLILLEKPSVERAKNHTEDCKCGSVWNSKFVRALVYKLSKEKQKENDKYSKL